MSSVTTCLKIITQNILILDLWQLLLFRVRELLLC